MGELTGGIEQIKQESTFVVILDPDDLLRDVLTRAAHTTHRQEDVVVQEVTCQNLNTVE